MRISKPLYGILFAVVIPLLLAAWTLLLDRSVHLRPVHAPLAGLTIAAAGIVWMIWSTRTLVREAGGWPMNAFPPPRLATRGPYRWMRDPIYAGFVFAFAGTALMVGSAAGLWITTPLVVLCCAALVWGYERHDLRRRFGGKFSDPSAAPLIRLPPAESHPPTWRDWISTVLLVLLPWLVLYDSAVHLGPWPDARSGYFPFENRLPVLEWTEAVYGFTTFFVVLSLFFARTQRDLRRFCVDGLIATACGFFLYFVLPLNAAARPFVPETAIGRLLKFEERWDSPGTAFPSFHVLWALFAARLFASRGALAAAVGWACAALISASTISTGTHAIVDVLGAIILFFLIVKVTTLWALARNLAECVANSWREWRVGPVRVINHGVYAACGAFIGLLIVIALAGPHYQTAAFMTALASLVCAALWAQFVEGSPRLLRPFGYFGSLLGGAAAIPILAKICNVNVWVLMGSFAVAAPWIQACGRFRCLVQGCCHGAPAAEIVGIRYLHPRSRVCLFTDYRGQPLHPTQLYSVLSNIALGILLARLWFVGVPPQMVAGAYLILSAIARFVEESYRGEPQTRVVAGLAIYQWLCIGCVILGAIFTVVPGATPPIRAAGLHFHDVLLAALIGLIVWCAMSVDFPASNRRFARLSG